MLHDTIVINKKSTNKILIKQLITFLESMKYALKVIILKKKIKKQNKKKKKYTFICKIKLYTWQYCLNMKYIYFLLCYFCDCVK